MEGISERDVTYLRDRIMLGDDVLAVFEGRFDPRSLADADIA